MLCYGYCKMESKTVLAQYMIFNYYIFLKRKIVPSSSILFCLLVIITELLLRRRTSWGQHTESLVLPITWIILAIFWSSFPVRILIFPILHEWKFLFLTTLVDFKVNEIHCLLWPNESPVLILGSRSSERLNSFNF